MKKVVISQFNVFDNENISIPLSFEDLEDREVLIKKLQSLSNGIQSNIIDLLRLLTILDLNSVRDLTLEIGKLTGIVNKLNSKTVDLESHISESAQNKGDDVSVAEPDYNKYESLKPEFDGDANENSGDNSVSAPPASNSDAPENDSAVPDVNPDDLQDPDSIKLDDPKSDINPVLTEKKIEVSDPLLGEDGLGSEPIEPSSNYFGGEEDPNHDIDFNQLVEDSKYKRAAMLRKRMDENLTDEAREERELLKKIEILRARLTPSGDPNGYLSNDEQERLDKLLSAKLDEIENDLKYEQPYVKDQDDLDAELSEALKVYESLDREMYPEIYEVDKNSLVHLISSQIRLRKVRRTGIGDRDEIKRNRLENVRKMRDADPFEQSPVHTQRPAVLEPHYGEPDLGELRNPTAEVKEPAPLSGSYAPAESPLEPDAFLGNGDDPHVVGEKDAVPSESEPVPAADANESASEPQSDEKNSPETVPQDVPQEVNGGISDPLFDSLNDIEKGNDAVPATVAPPSDEPDESISTPNSAPQNPNDVLNFIRGGNPNSEPSTPADEPDEDEPDDEEPNQNIQKSDDVDPETGFVQNKIYTIECPNALLKISERMKKHTPFKKKYLITARGSEITAYLKGNQSRLIEIVDNARALGWQ